MMYFREISYKPFSARKGKQILVIFYTPRNSNVYRKCVLTHVSTTDTHKYIEDYTVTTKD